MARSLGIGFVGAGFMNRFHVQSLVGVRDEKCYSCGRVNPGLWGFGPALRQLGTDFAFGPIVVGACVTLWLLTVVLSGSLGGGWGSGVVAAARGRRPRMHQRGSPIPW